MGKAAEARETAIMALGRAEAIMAKRDAGEPGADSPEAQGRFDSEMRAYQSGMARFHQLAAVEAEARAARDSGPMIGGMPMAGFTRLDSPSPALADGGRGAGSSFGAQFIAARSAGGLTTSGFSAALLEPGSVAVSIPLAATPIVDARRARFVAELIAQVEAPYGQYAYMRQTARTLRAAVVEPGDLKPTSVLTMGRVAGETKVIAHLSEPIDRFMVEDAPLLRVFLDQELQLGLNLALDSLIVAALLDDATPGEATVNLAGIRTAITTLQLGESVPSAILINPSDWQDVEDEAVSTFAANSNAPAATDAMDRRLYGVPVVVTNGITAGSVIVGDFLASAALYTTGGARIDLSDATPRLVDAATVSDFQLNQLVFRAERRANIAVGRPLGFVLVGASGS